MTVKAKLFSKTVEFNVDIEGNALITCIHTVVAIVGQTVLFQMVELE